MRVIVVTGGLGSGKSTAAKYFDGKGAVVVDLDDVAAKVLEPGSAVLGRVAAEFGEDEVLLADGRVDRAALARAAFATSASAARLDAIVHPVIARDVGVAIEQLRLMPEPPFAVVLEVPLLVEAPVFGELADAVVAIVAPESVRAERSVALGREREDAMRRIRVQASDAQRAELADVVVVNDGDLEHFYRELDAFWEEYVAIGGVMR
jgi:dephospho-CoA kinase